MQTAQFLSNSTAGMNRESDEEQNKNSFKIES